MNILNFNRSSFNETFVFGDVSELHVNYTNTKFDASTKYDRMYLFVKWKLYPYGKYVTCSMAILTNILVMATVIKCWKFWKYSSGVLMFTLACVDVIGNMIQIMVALNLYHVSLDYGITMPLIIYLSMTLPGISNFMMMLISLNRYALVCKPFSHYRITSKKTSMIQIIAIVTTLLCMNIYHFINFFSGKYRLEVFTGSIVVVHVLISHAVPMVVSVVFTILVIHEFRNNTSVLRESRNQGPPRYGQKNITKAMIAVIVAFILLTVPHAVAYTVDIVGIWINYNTNVWSFHHLLILLRDANYSINIFIYAAYIPTFRVSLKDVLKCKRSRKHHSYHIGNTDVISEETQGNTVVKLVSGSFDV